jgi:hypothetical protein
VAYFQFLRMKFKTDETREELQRGGVPYLHKKAPSITAIVT